MGLITKCSSAWIKKKTPKIKEQSRTTLISSFMKKEKCVKSMNYRKLSKIINKTLNVKILFSSKQN